MARNAQTIRNMQNITPPDNPGPVGPTPTKRPRQAAQVALGAALSLATAFALWPDPKRRQVALDAAAREAAEAAELARTDQAGELVMSGVRLRWLLDGITGLGITLGPVFTHGRFPGPLPTGAHRAEERKP